MKAFTLPVAMTIVALYTGSVEAKATIEATRLK